MRVLGLETSCDDTGVAVYEGARGLLGHRLHSQARLHAEYGGVVPELASRDHIRRLLPLVRELLAAHRGRNQCRGLHRGPGAGWLTEMKSPVQASGASGAAAWLLWLNSENTNTNKTQQINRFIMRLNE